MLAVLRGNFDNFTYHLITPGTSFDNPNGEIGSLGALADLQDKNNAKRDRINCDFDLH